MSSSWFVDFTQNFIDWFVEHGGISLMVGAISILFFVAATSIPYFAQLWSYKAVQSAKMVSIILTLIVLIGGTILLLLALGMSSTTIFGVGVGAITSFFVLPCSTFLYDIFAGVTIFITGRVQVGEEIIFKGFIGEIHGIVKSINTTHTSILQKNGIMMDVQNSCIYSGWISHIPQGNFDITKITSPSGNNTTTNHITFVQKPFFSL